MKRLYALANRFKKADMYSPFGEQPEEEEEEYTPDMPSPGEEMTKAQPSESGFSPAEVNHLVEGLEELIVSVQEDIKTTNIRDRSPDPEGDRLRQEINQIQGLIKKVQGLK